MAEAFLLAAGESRRMGKSKPLLPFGDTTVLTTMAIAFRDGGCAPVAVVHRAEDAPIRRAIDALGLRGVANPDPSPGMSSSVAVAAEAATGEWLALCPCDMPLLTGAAVARLGSALAGCQADVLQPEAEGRRKHPLFVRRAWLVQRAERLRGGTPLRNLLGEAKVAVLGFHDATEFRDFDTPAEYEELLRIARARG